MPSQAIGVNTSTIHTEEIKKKYTSLEREIKKKLTEVILLNKLATDENTFRGLSITKDFQIRELGEPENNKFAINLASIKDGTLENTEKKITQELFDLIERNVDEKDIELSYKQGITNFFGAISNKKYNYLKGNEAYTKFIAQYHELYKNKNEKGIAKFNVIAQVSKILYDNFWEKAFVTLKSSDNSPTEKIELSEVCRDYFFTLFYHANEVWKSWGGNIGQVFHDGDFPFITENLKGSNEEYLQVIEYLVKRKKHNPYGKRGEEWIAERATKTTKYADILWWLTNKQIRMDENLLLNQNKSEYTRDPVTQKLDTIGWGLLNNVLNTHNEFDLSQSWWAKKPLKMSKRLKWLSSSVEKVIEGKNINDTLGFRISMENANGDIYFEDILKISKEWFKALISSMKVHPEKYVEPWEQINIASISVDNKWVLKKDQMWKFIQELSTIISPIQERGKPSSPYISYENRKEKMLEHYKEDIQDTEKRKTYSRLFNQFAGEKKRGSNWDYKDFKFNIYLDIKDINGNLKWVRTIEVQFDDVNNNLGIANFNIRNCERSVNTQSNLSLDLSLNQVRRIVEINLKKMSYWAKDKDPKFSILEFENGTKIDISGFLCRNEENSRDMDIAIVEIINYFIKKGTFMFYKKNKTNEDNASPVLENWLLSCRNLSNQEDLDKIRICSGLELARQQYSYLENRYNDYIGIYIPEDQKVWWASLGEIIDRMNLGKVKNSEYTA